MADVSPEPERDLADVDASTDTESDFIQTFERVTSKENTSDKVVLVDFFAE